MKKILFCFLILTFNYTLFSQTIPDVVGNWKFESVTEDVPLTDSKKASFNTIMASHTLNFGVDKRYTGSIMGIEESGTWKLNDSTIELYNGKTTMPVTIVAFDKNKLTLKMRQMVYTMTKTATITNSIKTQIAKKWELVERKSADPDTIIKLPNGNYLDFSINGNYTVAFGNNKESGIWDYDEAHKAIMLNTNGRAKYWGVVKISQTDMVLIMGSGKEEYIFKIEN